MTSIDEAMAVGRAVGIDEIAALHRAGHPVTTEEVQHVDAPHLAVPSISRVTV